MMDEKEINLKICDQFSLEMGTSSMPSPNKKTEGWRRLKVRSMDSGNLIELSTEKDDFILNRRQLGFIIDLMDNMQKPLVNN